MELAVAPTGRPSVRFGVVAKSAARSASSVDAAPTLAGEFTQFNNFQASLSRGGSALGYVTADRLGFSNNVEAVRDIGSGAGIREAIEGDSQVSGGLSVRLADTTLLADSEGTAPIAKAITYAIGPTRSIAFLTPRIFLPVRRAQVQGRAGVQAEFEYRGAHDPTLGCALQVTLRNQVEGY